MSNLKISPIALQVIDTSISLFDRYGFHGTGIEFILKETQIAKMTFYNNFRSKERFIEICMIVQKDRLKQDVLSIIYSFRHLTIIDKLKEIYFLHADLNSPYHLLFKSIFEIEKQYAHAHQIVIEYREWLVQEILELLSDMETCILKPDIEMFLFIIDGTMVQLLSGYSVEEREVLWAISIVLSKYN